MSTYSINPNPNSRPILY